MDNIVVQLVSQLQIVSSSPLALAGYFGVLIVWLAIAFRVKRNKELLRNIEKLSEKDRLKAFQSEIGEVPIKGGFTPEQYLKFRNYRYYFFAAIMVFLLIAYLLTLAVVRPFNHRDTSNLTNEWSNYQLISQSEYDSDTEKNIDFFCKYWECGDNGIWKTSITEGKFWAENNISSSNIYYRVIEKTNLLGDWDKIVDIGPLNPISVDVVIAEGDSTAPWGAGAGLLFRFRPNNYYVYIISTAGEVSFLQFSNGSISTIFKKKIQNFSKDISYKLGISGNKEQIFLYFNDVLLQTLSDTKNINGPGGIVYFGKGRYAFDNFRIYSAVAG